MVDTTSPSLLIRIRDRDDTDAWSKFYDLYGPLLYRYARSRGLSHDDAEDVRGNCYEAIVKQIKTFEYDKEKGGFKAWLRTLVNRRVVDRLRKRKSQALESKHLRDVQAETPAADELWDEYWKNQHLRYCIEAARQNVSTQSYEAFQLMAQEGLSAQAVAERLGLNTNQVYKAKARVLKAIRQQMALIYPDEISGES